MDGSADDSSVSVTALVVVLVLVFASYFTVRAVLPELALHVNRALMEMPRS